MKVFGNRRFLIVINGTAKNYAGILPSLIDARALFGCDFVPKLYGTGKKIVIKHLKEWNLSLSSLRNTAASLVNIYGKSTKLVSSYYGIKNANNLSEVQFSV